LAEVALVSDIHANIEACDAVLADIDSRGIGEVLCLGDVIGYGPNPRECLERAYGFSFSLLGNHEEAVLYYAEDFNEKARRAIEWTKEQLNSSAYDKDSNYRIWNYLDAMERSRVWEDVLLVHASPRDPTKEYLLPHDVRNPDKLHAVFASMDQMLCFCGHSHVPGVYADDVSFTPAAALPDGFRPDSRKCVINVGSVGQPRDGDPRSCYVTYDGSTVRFVRVEYDFRKTMEKIRSIDALPDFLADRLSRGK
jgi:diadenosine tetraphosphatase ApaH/serine/threonine PP2A family protein phosphatase